MHVNAHTIDVPNSKHLWTHIWPLWMSWTQENRSSYHQNTADKVEQDECHNGRPCWKTRSCCPSQYSVIWTISKISKTFNLIDDFNAIRGFTLTLPYKFPASPLSCYIRCLTFLMFCKALMCANCLSERSNYHVGNDSSLSTDCMCRDTSSCSHCWERPVRLSEGPIWTPEGHTCCSWGP